MEKTTIYIHKEKEEPTVSCDCGEHRVVTFVNGKRDIMEVIKDLIKTQYQP